MFKLESEGNFDKTRAFLERALNGDIYPDLHRFGRIGADALAGATPVDTGATSSAWGYRILDGNPPGIEWYNDNSVAGTPLVILLQYGHGTGTGGYVVGRDFINPAIRPIFDAIGDALWKEVTR